MDELRTDPLFFFIMEMMNVPLSPKDTLKACNMVSNFPSLSQSIAPVVVDSAEGGEDGDAGDASDYEPSMDVATTNPTQSPPQQARATTSETP